LIPLGPTAAAYHMSNESCLVRHGDLDRQSGHTPQWGTCGWVVEMKNLSFTVRNTCRARKRRLDVSSRRTDGSHSKVRRLRTSRFEITSSSWPSFSSPSLLSSPWYGSCVDGLKTQQKLIRTKMYHGLGQNTPNGCGIHKRLGSGPPASGRRVVYRAEELSALRVNL